MAVTISRSAKLFQERRIPADRTTRRLPAPRSNLDMSKIHQIPLQPPYPSSDVVRLQGGQPPDGGLTQIWPWSGLPAAPPPQPGGPCEPCEPCLPSPNALLTEAGEEITI